MTARAKLGIAMWAGAAILLAIALRLFLEAAHAVSYPATGRLILRIAAALIIFSATVLALWGTAIWMHRLSQEGLAEATGLDRTFLSNIEMGQRRPSLDVLLLLARGLDISLATLFDGLGPGLHGV